MSATKSFTLHFVEVFITLTIAMILMVGCDSKVSSVTTDTGFLEIVFPNNSRSLLNSEAASVANTYCVVVWNSDGNIVTVNSKLHNGEIPLISLAAGTYKVIGFASYCDDETATIVGAGYVANVIVESNKTTDVEITLSAPTVVVDVPATAYESETINIPCYTSFGNNPIVLSGGYYYLKNSDGSIKNQGGLTDSSIDVLMPLTEGEYYIDVHFDGHIQIIDEWFAYGLSGIVSFEGWSWGIYKVSSEFEEYNNLFHQKITVLKRPTSLSVSFKWAED